MRYILALLLVFSAALLYASTNGTWLKLVPEQERNRSNPYAGNADAATAGAILYQRHCASCHGRDARGSGKRPDLHSAQVHDATDGELHWLLTNGDLARGMPSWSGLPDAQRWQIIRYLHSLPVDAAQ